MKTKPQLVCTARDGAEVLGYVVIDSTVNGRAVGGLRMLPDIDEAEIRGLARAMTLKYGFLGLRHGGAKAGVFGDPDVPIEERRERLRVFGQAIAPLLRKRIYVPSTDMGTGSGELREVLIGAGIRSRPGRRGSSTGDYTALTVLIGVEEAVRHLGLDLTTCRVVIEGFGKVGSALARLIADAGAKVVAISTARGALHSPDGLNVGRLLDLSQRWGSRVVEHYADAQRITRESLLELPTDILCPCARHESIHEGNAAQIQARVVVPGANNPITAGAEQTLFERGVLCLPDFVTNSGGVLGGTMEFSGPNNAQVAAFIHRYIGSRVADLLVQAAEAEVTPREIAVPLAQSRFDKMAGAGNDLTTRIFKTCVGLYRRGWVPRALASAVALAYFRRSLAP